MAVVGQKRRKSSVWAYFEKQDFNPGIAKCLLCAKNFHRSNNTSNLLKHLKSIHPAEFHLISADKESQSAALVLYAGPIVKKSCSPKPSRGVYAIDSVRKRKLDEALVEMLALDMQPVKTVTSRGFVKFVNLIDPKYILPTRAEISDSFLPSKYNEVKEKLQNSMLLVQSVAISTETWSPRPSEEYLSITAHYITENWQMRSCLLEVVHILDSNGISAGNIATEIYKIICEWKLENKVTVVITHNYADMQPVMEHLGWNFIVCFGSLINSVVNDCLGRDAQVAILQKKCNKIGSLFHTNIDAAEKLVIFQKELNLSCDTIRRNADDHWISTYHMFECIFEQVEAINLVVCTLNIPTLVIANEEQKVLKEAIELLKPFHHATVDMTMESHVSLSKVIPLVKLLVYATSHSESTLVLKNLLLSELHKHFGTVEQSEFMACGTLLDPRFKKMGFNSIENSEEAAQLLITKIPTDNMFALTNSSDRLEDKQDTSSLWKIFDQEVKAATGNHDFVMEFTDEYRKFSDIKLISRTNDPLMWWKVNGYGMPTLSILAKKYLGCPATAIPCKRLFTKAGEHFAKKICNLKQKTSGMFLFLNANLDLVQ